MTTRPTTTDLFLIRHAEVEARYHRVFGGRIDMDLSPLGHEQATALAQWLRHHEFDAVYASPMKRVQQTLGPLTANGAPKAVLLDGLREVDFGDWTGLSWEDVKERFQISAYEWLNELERGSIPNAESSATYRTRIESSLRQILREQPGRRVAIVCHGGVVRVLLSILLELPLPKMAVFEIDYASVTHVALFPHKTEVQFLNFAPWRDAR